MENKFETQLAAAIVLKSSLLPSVLNISQEMVGMPAIFFLKREMKKRFYTTHISFFESLKLDAYDKSKYIFCNNVFIRKFS